MGLQFQKGMFYRMPVSYGPSAGPRQRHDGHKWDCQDSPFKSGASVHFLSDAAKLEALLPPGFTLHGEPVVTVEIAILKEIDWLGGRGYNTLGVRVPARYQGKRDEAIGSFLTVLWENLTDPILTGREELGYSKIYCEIPEPRIYQGEHIYSGAWLGHKFVEVRLKDLAEVDPKTVGPGAGGKRHDGILHYKHMPTTGDFATAEVSYATLTPVSGHTKVHRALAGSGSVSFRRSEWEDLPTMCHIVNILADLPILEYRGATLIDSRGGKDFSDQKKLV